MSQKWCPGDFPLTSLALKYKKTQCLFHVQSMCKCIFTNHGTYKHRKLRWLTIAWNSFFNLLKIYITHTHKQDKKPHQNFQGQICKYISNAFNSYCNVVTNHLYNDTLIQKHDCLRKCHLYKCLILKKYIFAIFWTFESNQFL